MNIIADLHTHTMVSHHAYSTLAELVDEAKLKNLYAIAMTDHAPGLNDGAHRLHFRCIGKVPALINGVRVLRGTELNIMDFKGTIDLEDKILNLLDFVIASYHGEVIKPGTKKQHTEGWLGAIQNPHIDCLGHSGNPQYDFDIETVLTEVKRLEKIIEINTSSEEARPGSTENCVKIAKLCKKLEIPVCVNTDSHTRWKIGDFQEGIDLLTEINFPEELVINSSIERLESFFENRQKRISRFSL